MHIPRESFSKDLQLTFLASFWVPSQKVPKKGLDPTGSMVNHDPRVEVYDFRYPNAGLLSLICLFSILHYPLLAFISTIPVICTTQIFIFQDGEWIFASRWWCPVSSLLASFVAGRNFHQLPFFVGSNAHLFVCAPILSLTPSWNACHIYPKWFSSSYYIWRFFEMGVPPVILHL